MENNMDDELLNHLGRKEAESKFQYDQDPDVGSYRYFQYLEDGAFVTGEFKNQLPSFDDGKQMIIV